ncbi:hypothetical protein KSX_13850 [Ktedonospora formicarum]|uniref:Cytidyltransferase-like domain-containing protein n=1 Tax=Ktedonospora formicarum TaxID=2778364 RepID=A0A8J3HYZ1_9CHLR|nr:hypothetical protein KSX_13850 [Ktedonospora formicarum]
MRGIQHTLDQLDPRGEPLALSLPGSPTPEGNIIVFTGSFNPPTLAHLAMLKQAQQYARAHAPMRLYTAMSKQTVDKESVTRPLFLDRLELLTRLMRRFRSSGVLLFNRGLYAEQALAIRHSLPNVRAIYFLMGFDKIVQILDPRYYEDRDKALEGLFAQARLLVAPRGNDGPEALHALLERPENTRFAAYIQPLTLNNTYREISATHIRRQDQGYEQAIPREVWEFMWHTRAYMQPLRERNGCLRDYYGERVQALSRLLGTQPT